MLVLGFVLLMSILIASLLSAEQTSDRVSPRLATTRAKRYGADSAMQAGINWLKANPLLGRDPIYSSPPFSDPPCALNVTTTTGTVAMTCVGDTGSGVLPGGTFPNATPLQPRVVTLLTCMRGAGRSSSIAACDAAAGDTLLVRARVRFDVTTDASNNPATNVPEVLAWKQLA